MSMYITTDRGTFSMTLRGTEAPTASRADRSPEVRSGLPTGLRALFRAMRGRWLEHKLYKAERAQLVDLLSVEDHLLTDIGLCRHDVQAMIQQLDAHRAYARRNRITTSTRATAIPLGT